MESSHNTTPTNLVDELVALRTRVERLEDAKKEVALVKSKLAAGELAELRADNLRLLGIEARLHNLIAAKSEGICHIDRPIATVRELRIVLDPT